MWNIRRIFIVALAIRLALAPFATLSATFENVSAVDTILVQNFNPLSYITSYGPAFYLTYVPFYVPYLLMNLLGVHAVFLLEFLFKIPSIIGDILCGYALFNIAFELFQDYRKATVLSAVYLLNPYTIFISAVVGHLDPLMMGLIMTSMYLTLKGRTQGSALSLAFASALRFLPALLFPFFYLYLHKQSRQKARPYLYTFVSASVLLFSPYLLTLVQLGLTSQPLVSAYVQSFVRPVSILGGSSPTTFKYNFTGFLASTGLWSYASTLSNVRTFVVTYIGLLLVFVFLGTWGFRTLTCFSGVLFGTFMLVIPLDQAHYLSWFLPFVLLGAFAYSFIPRQGVAILIATNFAIWPIVDPGFLVSLDATFPGIAGYGYLYSKWPFLNLNFQLSLSVMYGVTVAVCSIILLFYGISSDRSASVSRESLPGDGVLALVTGEAFVLTFETLRLVYFPGLPFISALTTLCALVLLAIYANWMIPRLKKEDRHLPWMPRAIMLALSVLFGALTLQTGSTFLLTQAIFIALIAFTRRFRLGSIVAQLIMVWSTLYISYLSLTSLDVLQTFLTITTLVTTIIAWLAQLDTRFIPRSIGIWRSKHVNR